jgi:predicted Zn-dependent peptidase
MKLISSFKNKYDNITYKTYETSNGIKVLHLDNPSTINFDLSVLHSAGCAFEKAQNVPKGTAHFLEHLLLNPNSYFKDQDEINKFEQGTLQRPALDINGNTNKKCIVFEGHSNEKGTQRILERFEKIYDFPKDKFSTLLEKERNVILAEKSRKVKKSENNGLMYLDFMFNGIADEFTGDTLGEIEDIKSITIDDLEKYYKDQLLSGYTVISIQSRGELKEDVVKSIDSISKRFSSSSKGFFRDFNLENQLKVGVFRDKRANGITVYFDYIDKNTQKVDYEKDVLSYVCSKLLSWLSFNILREKKGLIYNFSRFKTANLSFYYNIYSYSFTTEKEKFKKTLEEYFNLVFSETFKFLKSKKGVEWFEDVISDYIFPTTVIYESDRAELNAIWLLEKQEIFNFNKAVERAKTLTIEDLEKYIKKEFEIPPHIWIEGDMSKKELEGVVKESSFNKKYSIRN